LSDRWAPDVVDMLRQAGLRLTLGLSEATIQSPSIVVVDQGLTQQLAEEEEITADIVSYRQNVTGLGNTVFISVKFPRHTPHIKVAIDPPTHVDPFGDTASVAIEDGPVVAGKLPSRALEQVKRFIDANRPVSLNYWEKRIDTDQLRERLRKIEG
jgi:hypothetical protein